MSRNYLIIQATDASSVDFAAVCETSAETLRYSQDQTRTFIKWDSVQPAFVAGLTNTEGPYSKAEMRTILASDAWASLEEN